MHIKDLKIVESFNITGRGKAFVTNLDYDLHCKDVGKGDTFTIKDKTYKILSIEAVLRFDGEIKKDFMSFIAKEITEKELLSKENKTAYLNICKRMASLEKKAIRILGNEKIKHTGSGNIFRALQRKSIQIDVLLEEYIGALQWKQRWKKRNKEYFKTRK